MRNKKWLPVCCATLLLGFFALIHEVRAATDYDLDACMFSNGLPMHPKSCESLRKRAAQQAVDQARAKEKRERQQQELQEWREKKQAEEQEMQRLREKQQAERQAKRDAEKAMALKAQQEQLQWERATAKAAAEKEAVLQAECGKDYKTIAIGMTIERAQKCVANLRMTGQINRVDGVVSTYQAGRLYAHVMDGRIVSWGK